MSAAPEPAPPTGTVAVSQWFSSRGGGIAVPLAATALAFLIGGLIVAIDGENPVTAYKAIFEGTGLNWFFPWVTGEAREDAARDLQQTLLVATPLMLTALAVAFAFRCGLFNIGGQGQFWVGLIAAIYVGTHLEGSRARCTSSSVSWPRCGRGHLGGIAGLLKAAVGAHEVITTIMLNWIAIYAGSYLFEPNGPLQGDRALPRSNEVFESAKLWPIWGNIQALHSGLFIALFALIVYHLLLNRTTLGYEVRAVGFNPEAARYGGISVPRNYFLALGIAGGFAGLAGGVDVLGWRFDVDTSAFDANAIGFTGIAVALLGRTRPSASCWPASCSGRSRSGRRRASWIPRCSIRGSPATWPS